MLLFGDGLLLLYVPGSAHCAHMAAVVAHQQCVM
jgi:hypothetical protein